MRCEWKRKMAAALIVTTVCTMAGFGTLPRNPGFLRDIGYGMNAYAATSSVATPSEGGEKEEEPETAAYAPSSPATALAVKGVTWDRGEWAGWVEWDKDQFSAEEKDTVKRMVAVVYKDGQFLEKWHTGRGLKSAANLRCSILEDGAYQVKIVGVPDNSWPSDAFLDSVEFSDAYVYQRPDQELAVPANLRWDKDGTMRWDKVDKATDYIVQIYAPVSGDQEILDEEDMRVMEDGYILEDTIFAQANKCDNFIPDMKKDVHYRFKVRAVGNPDVTAAGERSDFSPEFNADEVYEQAQGVIDNLMNGDVTQNVDNTVLSSDDKKALKLAVQTSQSFAESYEVLEDAYSGSAVLNATSTTDVVDANEVKVVGGLLNGASGIKLEDAGASEIPGATVSRSSQWKAVNISLEFGSAASPQGDLKYPVLITLPVMDGMDPERVIIYHVKHDGAIEEIRPRINYEDDPVTLSFAVTSFSTFVFSEKRVYYGSNGGNGTPVSGAVYTADYTVNYNGETGSWIQDAAGWRFKKTDGGYPAGRWMMTGGVWYRFDGNGYMMTGWFTDLDGKKYYLNPVSDGTKGSMKTGWQVIDGKSYYFNTVSDGSKGALLVNTTTPDGSRVDENGVKIQQ